MAEQATAEDVAALRRELEETRRDLGEVKALLRQQLERRAPRRPPPGPRATPEVREKVRAKLAGGGRG